MLLLFFSGALLLPLEGVILNFCKMPKRLKNYCTFQAIIIIIFIFINSGIRTITSSSIYL